MLARDAAEVLRDGLDLIQKADERGRTRITLDGADLDPPTDSPITISEVDSPTPRASYTDTDAYEEQAEILATALRIYGERNKHYKDNWRRFGWRGCLFRLRERTERAWDMLWDQGVSEVPDSAEDDLIDLINFACFTIRALREGNRDGSWWE